MNVQATDCLILRTECLATKLSVNSKDERMVLSYSRKRMTSTPHGASRLSMFIGHS